MHQLRKPSMIITTIVLFSNEGNNFSEPEVFASATEVDCVNQVKQHMVECYEVGFYEEDEASRTAFNSAGTFDELRSWFVNHYCSVDIKENIIVINQPGRTAPVLMLQP